MSEALPSRDLLVAQLAEVFREYGYEGTSMARIHAWFEERIFAPLDEDIEQPAAIVRS